MVRIGAACDRAGSNRGAGGSCVAGAIFIGTETAEPPTGYSGDFLRESAELTVASRFAPVRFERSSFRAHVTLAGRVRLYARHHAANEYCANHRTHSGLPAPARAGAPERTRAAGGAAALPAGPAPAPRARLPPPATP